MKLNAIKMLFSIALLVTVLVLWSTIPVKSQDKPLKFASIDVKVIFDNYDRVQMLQAKLKDQSDAIIQKRNQLEDKLKRELENFRVQRDMMGEQAVFQRQIELQQMKDDMVKALAEEERRIHEIEAEGTEPILVELNATIKQYAQENGYDFIFKRKNMAYVDDKYDITQDIIKLLAQKQ